MFFIIFQFCTDLYRSVHLWTGSPKYQKILKKIEFPISDCAETLPIDASHVWSKSWEYELNPSTLNGRTARQTSKISEILPKSVHFPKNRSKNVKPPNFVRLYLQT